jgi:hypothetical protein
LLVVTDAVGAVAIDATNSGQAFRKQVKSLLRAEMERALNVKQMYGRIGYGLQLLRRSNVGVFVEKQREFR